MKINVLKTTLATTALFTAISCLVQAPARAWGGDYDPNGSKSFNFSITPLTTADTLSSPTIGLYEDVVKLSPRFPSFSADLINQSPLDLKTKKCCQAGIPGFSNIGDIKNIFTSDSEFPDDNDDILTTFPIKYSGNSGIQFYSETDFAQYSFTINDVDNSGILNGEKSTFFVFVPNYFTLNGKTIKLDIDKELINSLSGLGRIDNEIGEFNPLIVKAATKNLPIDPDHPGDNNAVKTPEASNMFALLALGIVGMGGILKHKNNSHLEV